MENGVNATFVNEHGASTRPDVSAGFDIGRRARRLLHLKDGIEAVPDVVALGAAAIPFLEPLVRGPSESIFEPRCLVADTLGLIGGEAAVDALLRALDDCAHRHLDPILDQAEQAVISRIAENLGKLGDPRARHALGEALRLRPCPGVIRALAALGVHEAIPRIVRALSDDYARPASVEAIRAFGRAAVPVLIALLSEKPRPATERGRAAAARLLGELRALEAGDALARALAGPWPSVRREAALALSAMGKESDEIIGVLVESLDAVDAVSAEESLNALLGLGEASESCLIETVRVPPHNDAQRRRVRRAIECLEKIGSLSGREAIAALHESKDVHIRFRALQALGRAHSPHVAPLIAPFLHDADSIIQRLAVESLRQLRREGAEELIRALPGAGLSRRLRLHAALSTMGADAAHAAETLFSGSSNNHDRFPANGSRKRFGIRRPRP